MNRIAFGVEWRSTVRGPIANITVAPIVPEDESTDAMMQRLHIEDVILSALRSEWPRVVIELLPPAS